MYNSVFEMHCNNNGGQAGAGLEVSKRSRSNSLAFSTYLEKVKTLNKTAETAEAAGPIEQQYRELAPLYKEAAEIRPEARKAMKHLAEVAKLNLKEYSQQGAKLKLNDMPPLKRTTCAVPCRTARTRHSQLSVLRPVCATAAAPTRRLCCSRAKMEVRGLGRIGVPQRSSTSCATCLRATTWKPWPSCWT